MKKGVSMVNRDVKKRSKTTWDWRITDYIRLSSDDTRVTHDTSLKRQGRHSNAVIAVGLRGVLNIAEGLPGSIMWMVPGRVCSGFLNGGSKHHHLW